MVARLARAVLCCGLLLLPGAAGLTNKEGGLDLLQGTRPSLPSHFDKFLADSNQGTGVKIATAEIADPLLEGAPNRTAGPWRGCPPTDQRGRNG